MVDINFTNPAALGAPLGQYCQVARVKAATEYLFVAGQVGMTREGKLGSTFDEQCSIAFANTLAALQDCGAGWENVVQFTTYLVHSQDIPLFMQFRLREFPHFFGSGLYPPNTLLMIDRLVQEPLLFEVQTIAAL